MKLFAIGLNHKTAPVQIRERASVSGDTLVQALRDISNSGTVREAAILSTCNRTEVYCRDDRNEPEIVVRWLSDFHHIPAGELAPYLYNHPGPDAVRHLFRVAAGLDSMVLGEPQILGQMKQAFTEAHRAGTTGKILNRLFQQTFNVAKQIRTDTAIGASAVSVAYAAVSLARSIFSTLSEQSALLIGAGETIELAARHLREQGVGRMIVANRTLERAQPLAGEFRAEAIALTEMPERLHDADIVISSTASPLPILGKGAVERAIRRRRRKPMFIVDLAVPRDVEEEVGELSDVYLYSIDDLQQFVQDNLETRRAAAQEAEKIVNFETERFMRWLRSLNAVPTILDLRRSIDAMAKAEVERAQRRLAAGDDPGEVMRQMAHALSQKFAHAPSDTLKAADHEGNPELLAAARRLFRLPEH
jgi:glutamyl-tRNA reductase